MWIVIAIAIVVVVGLGTIGFSRPRRADTGARTALVEIDTQLSRRAELIPCLVNMVKGHAKHERAVFDEAIAARAGATRAAKSGTVDEKAAAQGRLDEAICDVLAVAEAYPAVTASADFELLQAELSDTESEMSSARQHYNDAVGTLNSLAKTIPSPLITRIVGVGTRESYIS